MRSTMGITRLAGSQPLNFLQLGGVFQVKGTVGGHELGFSARGSAETFRPQSSGSTEQATSRGEPR